MPSTHPHPHFSTNKKNHILPKYVSHQWSWNPSLTDYIYWEMIHINFRHHPNIIFMTDRVSVGKGPLLIPGIHSLFLQIHIVNTAWRDRIIKLK